MTDHCSDAMTGHCCHSGRKIKIENHTVSGGAWVAAWLFTIGYLHLAFWQGVLAIVIWPYYLGVFFSLPLH